MSRLLLVLALLAIVGCGGGGPRLLKVTGTVTFDGSPLPDGDITFAPTDPALGARQGKVRQGQFELLAHEGKNRVEVTASRIRPGGAKGAGGEPVPEEYLPERYNVATILKADVTSGGANEFRFPLEKEKK